MTISAIERELLFREAVARLCREHGAELQVATNGKPYGLASPVLLVSMMSVYDGDVRVKDYTEFEW